MYKISYGIKNKNIDVTHFYDKNTKNIKDKHKNITIPKQKNKIFGDPVPRVKKFIFVKNKINGKTFVFDEKKEIKFLVIKHNSGFFSCCSVKLNSIINFFNSEKKLPDIIDTTNLFDWYKPKNHKIDICNVYFNQKHKNIIYDEKINYHHTYQYRIYNTIDYESLTPFIDKYFNLSINIEKIMKQIINKYKINFDNTCVLFYRGNDKNRETALCSYEQILKYAKHVLNLNPNITFLVQSDETQFIEKMVKSLKKSIVFKNEIRHIKAQNTTVDKIDKSQNYKFSQYFLAITNIMSKCKYVVCTTGNCSIWIMLYRGNANNTIQFINNKIISSIDGIESVVQ
jgi:hypothetical protein